MQERLKMKWPGTIRIAPTKSERFVRLLFSRLGCHPQRVKKSVFVPVIAAILALFAAPFCPAQVKGYWRAASSLAHSITGDISIAKSDITINYYVFALVPVRALNTNEVAAAFDADVNSNATGYLYHLNVPASRRFMHHNTLCGTEETQWMATYESGRTLQVAFFSGATPPVITVDALANTMNLCGTYTYSR